MKLLLITQCFVILSLSASTIDYDAYAQYDLSTMQENDEFLNDMKTSGVPIAKHHPNGEQVLCDVYNGCSLDTDAGLTSTYSELGSQFSLIVWVFLVHSQQGPLLTILDSQSKLLSIKVEMHNLKLEYAENGASVEQASITKADSNTWCAVYFQKELSTNKFGIYFSKEEFAHGSLERTVELVEPLQIALSLDLQGGSLFTVVKELRIYNIDFKVPKLIQKIATNQCPAILNYDNKLGCGDQSDSMYLDFNFDKSRGGYSLQGDNTQIFHPVLAAGKQGHGGGVNGHYSNRVDSADCTFEQETGYLVMPHKSRVHVQNSTTPILNKVGFTFRTQFTGSQMRYEIQYSSYFFVVDGQNVGFQFMGQDEDNFYVKTTQNGRNKYFDTFTIDPATHFLWNEQDFNLITATFLKRKNSGHLTISFNNFVKSWDDPTFIDVIYGNSYVPRDIGLYQMFKGQKTRYIELNRRLMGVFQKTANMTNLCPQGTILDEAGLNCISCPTDCEVCDRNNIGVCLFPPSLICDYNCDTCTGPSATQCLSCTGGRILQSNQCLDCHSSCSTCEGVTTNCTSCAAPQNILYNGQCLSSCPEGTYQVNQTCAVCDNNCRKCRGTGPYNCTECKNDRVLYNSQCLAQCPRTTFNSANVCQQCPTRAQLLTKEELNHMLQLCVFPVQSPQGNAAIESIIAQNYSSLKDDLVLLSNYSSTALIQERSANISVIAQNAILSFHETNYTLQTQLYSLHRQELHAEIEFEINGSLNFQRIKAIFPEELTLHQDITVLFHVWKYGLFTNTISSQIQVPVFGVTIEAYDQVRNINNLYSPIQLKFYKQKGISSYNATGLYWNKEQALWSSQSISTIEESNQIIIQTQHLSQFTIKLQPIPIIEPPLPPVTEPQTNPETEQSKLVFKFILTAMVVIILISIWNDCYPQNYPHNRMRLSNRKSIEDVFPYVVIYNMPLVNICSYRDDVYLSVFRGAMFTSNFWVMLLLHSSYIFDVLDHDGITQLIVGVFCVALFSPSALLYKCLIKKRPKIDVSSVSQNEYKSDLIHREIRQNAVICLFTYTGLCWLFAVYFLFIDATFSSQIYLLKLCLTGLALVIIFTLKLWVQSLILMKCWRCMRCRCCVLLLSDVFTKRVLTEKSQFSNAEEVSQDDYEEETLEEEEDDQEIETSNMSD